MSLQKSLLIKLRERFGKLSRGTDSNWALSSRAADEDVELFNTAVARCQWDSVPLAVVNSTAQYLAFVDSKFFCYWISSFAFSAIDNWEEQEEHALAFWSSLESYFSEKGKASRLFTLEQLEVFLACIEFALQKAEEYDRSLFGEDALWKESFYTSEIKKLKQACSQVISNKK